jgi:hypothetical protein
VPALKYIEPVYTIPEIVDGDIPRLADDCVPEAVNVDAVVVESGAVVEFPVNVALPMVVQSAGDVLIVCELIIKFCPVPLNTPVCPVIVVAFTVDGVVAPIEVLSIVPPVMAAAVFSTLSVLRLVKLASTSTWVSGEPLPALVTIVDILS